MKRREFLKLATCGLTAIATGSISKIPPIFESEAYAAAQTINLTIQAALAEMIDLTQVFMWLFGTPTGPSFPGPVIVTTTGDTITINITNTLPQPHAFQILGTTVNTGPIPSGQTRMIRFLAPAAGTYMYIDPLNAPVNRVLGLHGAMIVLPKLVTGNITPYSVPSLNVKNLFNDLGRTPQFPGDSWSPDPASANHRERLWFFMQIDPLFNAAAQQGQTINPVLMKQNFLPRYFTINGKSGAFASHERTIIPEGFIGQPHVIRILNGGLANHSPHQHGNHVYVLAVNNAVQSNVMLVDTFTVGPTDRVDWLLPFIRPDDVPGNPATPLRVLLKNELALPASEFITPQSPLSWPMHCHMEMSQTAAGGNYPQGMVTHMEILGDVDKVPFPQGM
jgi:hypothetical protein